MHRLPTRRTCLAAVTLGLTCGLLALAPLSAAIVPPTDCGSIRVSGKRYTIKADQLRCRTAKPYASRYLATHHRPTGYTCHNYGRETKLKFRCSRGIKVFFAIRH